MVFQFVVILLPRLADLASEFCRVLRANRRSAGRIRAPTRVSRNLGCLAEPGVTIRPLRRGDSAARGMPASHEPLAPFDGPHRLRSLRDRYVYSGTSSGGGA